MTAGRGRPLRGALRRGARDARRRGAGWPERPPLEARLARAAAAREPVGEGLGADAAAAPRGARARPRGRRAPAAPAAAAREELGAHLHIDMESLDSLETTLELVLELLDEEEFATAPRPGSCCRPTCASRRSSSSSCSPGRGAPARAAARRPARQGRLLGPRDRRGAPARLAAAGVRGQGRLRPQLRGAHPPPAGRAAARARRDRLAQPALGRPRDRLRPRGGRRGPRPRAPGAARARRRPGRRAGRRGLRVRAYCPVGDLVAGMAYLVRRLLENTANESFLGEQARGAPLEELLAAP